MKNRGIFNLKSGFTIVELLVSMAITMIIVTVLVSVTSMAMDTWNRSRSELRSARQAKAMVDTMARDFEGLVTRRGNSFEWLSAISKPVTNADGDLMVSNAADLVFFTAATDRYNGEIGTASDLGGDVSCVGYKLAWKDPIGGESDENFKTLVLNRHIVDPYETFHGSNVPGVPDPDDKALLGKSEIGALFMDKYGAKLDQEENFVCENIFQFTVSFHVEITTAGVVANRIVSINPTGDAASFKVLNFKIKGTGIESTPAIANLQSAKITAIGISLSMLSDASISQLRDFPDRSTDAAWLAKNSYEYSKLVQLPKM